MSTENTTAVITGASSGIGATYADRLAGRGYDVILVARNKEKLDTVAERVRKSHDVTVTVLTADLTKDADLTALEARLSGDDSISVLVNNAGFGGAGTLLESEIGKMAEMIATNVTAPTRLTYAVVPGMVKRGGGIIINIASIVAIAPELLNGVYGGTKAFMLAFTQSLQHELSAEGIIAQAVLPGATSTEFWDVAGVGVGNLPSDWLMSTADLVDSALFGLDRQEKVTIPSLQDGAEWDAYEAARQVMLPHLSNVRPAPRYAAASERAA
ncbi:short-chain dehydrogenase of unknown substrate specificity [Rhizobium leguminosarum bv. trifolii WSM597]|uniref:Short-chain alcohol dehydrogenase n=1 Tax=Rhizobium leguminosarum bv. trifolii WSM597 TaxID=754764 RepID=J0H9D5_RHILT|nr:SDR family oxidoreductase [Rhizobium leguminosarum]EJB07005.1 short-chain dehydrogenase of unknown substrate specificity [Rhizobium leguminosarum bv. trifolii WSM597]